MDQQFERKDLPAVVEVADRLDSLAETAELMGDVNGAIRWRERAADLRLQAMTLLD